MVQAYDLKLKKMVDVKDPKIITKKTKNGRTVRMLMGLSSESGIKVSRILSNK